MNNYIDKYKYKKAYIENLKMQSKNIYNIEYCFENCRSDEYSKSDICTFTINQFQELIQKMSINHNMSNVEKTLVL